MTRSVFYNLASAEGERALERLRELGHRIGLHLWPGEEKKKKKKKKKKKTERI